MPIDMKNLESLCRRRGFLFGSSEIYGGINGFWDYGPLGVELKKNIKEAWWHDMVRNPPPGPDGQEIAMVGVDCAIIMNPKVWEASGHAKGFADPMVDCKAEGCKGRFRADQLASTACPLKPSKMAGEFEKCQLMEPRQFNLMFETYAGAVQDDANKVYLRPETAQGIFVNFKNVLDSTRLKLPFGVGQVGKAFRNEINPRNYTFRSREFEQMEIEFFCRPEESMKWYEYWRDVRKNWYTRLGIKSDNLRPREQGKEELAHYSIGTTDIEYLFPFSNEPQELEGVAHRGDFDLKAHMQHSGKDLSYFDEQLWQTADKSSYGGDKKKETEAKQNPPYRFVPHVIEPSAGADRFALAVLCEAYTEDKLPDEKGQMQERLLMKFHPRLAPVKAAILPLVNKEGMPEIAETLYRELKEDWNVQYDDGGAIGRRYRRQDEIGTPFCVTIDGETLQNQSVTIRERDGAQQRRVAIGEVAGEIKKAMKS
jgi:glycyl-tRNA synthetase